VANTYPAMAIDYRTGKSRLGPDRGSFRSGNQTYYSQAGLGTRKAVKTPILGLGGVETVEDVLDYLAVEPRQYRSGRPVLLTSGPVSDLLRSRANSFQC